MTDLELLAPAKNIEIGIAAIDCGADAVYIAGPAFGARQAAGNSMDDLAVLCRYAHRFGARLFMTLNTILYDSELEEAEVLMHKAEDIGIDALIVQDLAVAQMAENMTIPLHASTQCAIRTVDKALFYKSLGFSRLVLERELPLQTIRDISAATGCEIEFFVHGALCVCYSGQCYMSESISGRSANRGECIQACRSLYDLTDGEGRILMKNKALLSLKDYNLSRRIGDLADAGVCSFKIEGRLKNISYVKNTVSAYSAALDKLVSEHPDKYRRASSGHITGGFTPDLVKTFNRGYTELYLDGRRGKWSSMDTPKGMGEEIGKVRGIRPCTMDSMEISVSLKSPRTVLDNGDGFAFTGKGGEIIGFRGDICTGDTIRCRRIRGLAPGTPLFRNLSQSFEKTIAASHPRRLIQVNVHVSVSGDNAEGYSVSAEAVTEDGRKVQIKSGAGSEAAQNPERMKSLISSQIGKASDIFDFHVTGEEEGIGISTADGTVPFMTAASLNALRRDMADRLGQMPAMARPLKKGMADNTARSGFPPAVLDYKFNVSNHKAREVYMQHGAEQISEAFELSHQHGAELMRTKYCIRHELGICLKNGGCRVKGPLHLLNNGKDFILEFDCKNCEMTVSNS